MSALRPSTREALRKIDALKKAARGDLLSAEEEKTLLEIAEDYKPLIHVGNNKSVSVQDVVKMAKILVDDVRMMTGDRRRETILLLHRIGARGFERVDIATLQPHKRGDEHADSFAVDVTDEEIFDAVNG